MKFRSTKPWRILAAALSVALIAGACGGDDDTASGGGGGDDEKKAVEAAVRATVEAENDQDVDAFLALWTDKGLEAYDIGSREELKEDSEGFGEDEGEIVEFTKTTVSGNTATTEVVGAQSEFKIVQPLFLLSYELVKQNDKWLIDSFEYKGSPPPKEGTEVVEIKAQDYAFLLDTTEAPSDVAFTFENVGKEAHEIAIYKGPDDVDLATAKAALEDVDGSELEDIPDGYAVDHLSFADVGQPKQDITFADDLAPGTYFFVCYIPVGGMNEEGEPVDPEADPHIKRGMINTITIK